VNDNQNRLSKETSPYLLQHADNPVDWYPWGAEALKKAKDEDKPIFLSIGYSACHWCHVMAHESFSDADIARKMNEGFVNIKVDREERPDIDAIYMKSMIQLIGHGGWPLSVFLTPDQEPYFGGTYYPMTPKYKRPGFPQILEQALDWYNRKDNLNKRVGEILNNIQSSIEIESSSETPCLQWIDQAVEILTERYDAEHGGFGQGMKFPETMVYSLLLRYWLRTGSDDHFQILDHSLTKMAEGGLYDQLGGGFHRYSTDRNWRVPHFEKMLYDNALLSKLFLEMYQVTGQKIYKNIPTETFAYIKREMTSPEGYFYSSQDADTNGKEGEFYSWSLREVLNIMGPKPAKIFARAYGLKTSGNFGGENVLYVNDPLETIADEEDMPIAEVNHIVESGKKSLFYARQKRSRPGCDEKMITAWNGMMINALATAYLILRQEEYRDSAIKCAEFIWANMWKEGRLLRIYKDGVSKVDACLEDYAFLLESCNSLYEATFDSLWIDRAKQLADCLLADFYDDREGGFFMTGSSHEKLVARLKIVADEAIPSANAIAAQSLLKLASLTGYADYANKGESVIRAFSAKMERSPAAYTGLLSALDWQCQSPLEVVLAGPLDQPESEKLQHTVYQDYRPNKVVLWSGEPDVQEKLPLAEGRSAVKGEPTAYVCQKQTCHPPVQSADALDRLLERPPEIRLNLFDRDKKLDEIRQQQEGNFLNVMGDIFKQTGLR
jgi:uncharacterized protein YyaL (SSP411 family)